MIKSLMALSVLLSFSTAYAVDKNQSSQNTNQLDINDNAWYQVIKSNNVNNFIEKLNTNDIEKRKSLVREWVYLVKYKPEYKKQAYPLYFQWMTLGGIDAGIWNEKPITWNKKNVYAKDSLIDLNRIEYKNYAKDLEKGDMYIHYKLSESDVAYKENLTSYDRMRNGRAPIAEDGMEVQVCTYLDTDYMEFSKTQWVNLNKWIHGKSDVVYGECLSEEKLSNYWKARPNHIN